MDKKLKARWVKALRSGKYKQAKGVLLHTNGSMCCLGVLSKLVGVHDDRLLMSGTNGTKEIFRLLKGSTIDAGTLADMNDGGRSFKQIANYIERRK